MSLKGSRSMSKVMGTFLAVVGRNENFFLSKISVLFLDSKYVSSWMNVNFDVSRNQNIRTSFQNNQKFTSKFSQDAIFRIASFIRKPDSTWKSDEEHRDYEEEAADSEISVQSPSTQEENEGETEEELKEVENNSKILNENIGRRVSYRRNNLRIAESTETHVHCFHGMDYKAQQAIQTEPSVQLDLMPVHQNSTANNDEKTDKESPNFVSVTYRPRDKSSLTEDTTASKELD